MAGRVSAEGRREKQKICADGCLCYCPSITVIVCSALVQSSVPNLIYCVYSATKETSEMQMQCRHSSRQAGRPSVASCPNAAWCHPRETRTEFNSLPHNLRKFIVDNLDCCDKSKILRIKDKLKTHYLKLCTPTSALALNIISLTLGSESENVRWFYTG